MGVVMGKLSDRRVWACLVAVAVVMFGAVLAEPAGADDVPSEEAPAFARERGISLAEAEQRLAWQAVAPDLADRLETDLGDRFGGVWIDIRDGDRVKVGVTGEVDADSLAVITRAGDDVGLKEGYDGVPVARSLALLTRDMDRLGEEIARVNDGATGGLAAGIRTDLNALQLDVPDAALTPEQQSLVASMQRDLGPELIVQRATGTYHALSCSFPYCDPPLRGGVRITYPGTSCTAAFTAKSKIDGFQYLITAGHCAMDHYSNWSTKFADQSVHIIGPVWHWEYNANGDAAILRITNEPGWNPQPRVQVTDGPETTANELYAIADDKSSIVGMRICATGAATGQSRCGHVTELGFTTDYDGPTVHHLGRASVCAQKGDSGAPMYAKHNAYGILVAGNANDGCDTLYQGIHGAENLLNVNVLHG